MSDELQSLRARREVITGYLAVMADPVRLLRLVIDMDGDGDAIVAAIATEYGVSEFAASAISLLQVRRFSPEQVRRMREELARTEEDLAGYED